MAHFRLKFAWERSGFVANRAAPSFFQRGVRFKAKRNRRHDHHHHLVACQLAQRRCGRAQPQHDFDHERIVLIVVAEVVLELVSSQLFEESAALFVLLRLKIGGGGLSKIRKQIKKNRKMQRDPPGSKGCSEYDGTCRTDFRSTIHAKGITEGQMSVMRQWSV